MNHVKVAILAIVFVCLTVANISADVHEAWKWFWQAGIFLMLYFLVEIEK